MASKGKIPSTTGKSPTLEESLIVNWSLKEVNNLVIQRVNPNKCLIPSDREDEIKCILKNIAKIRNWQHVASQYEVVSLKTKIAELEQANKVLATKNESAASQDEVISLQRKITELEHAIKKLTTSNERLQHQITKDQSEVKAVAHHNEVQKLKQHLEVLNKENRQLHEILDKTKEEHGKLCEALESTKEAERKSKVEVTEREMVFSQQLEQARNEVLGLARRNASDKENIAALMHQMDEMKLKQQSYELNTGHDEVPQLKQHLKEVSRSEREKALTKEIEHARKEVSNLARQNELDKKELSNAKREIVTLQNLNKNIQAHIEARNGGKEVDHLKRQVKDLTDRLATETKFKISEDEKTLENISIQNRPMKLADDYQHFCSHVWLDAKEALDGSRFEQKDAIVLLQEVLLVSEERCSRAAKCVNRILMQVLNEPGKGEYRIRKEKELTQPIPDSAGAIFNGVGDYLRRTGASVDLTSITEEVAKTLAARSKNVVHRAYETYIEEAVRLSWNMAIQRPPMTFSVEGQNKKWEGEEAQELYWGSHPEKKGAVVRYYVHPKLKRGDILMVKGRVLVE